MDLQVIGRVFELAEDHAFDDAIALLDQHIEAVGPDAPLLALRAYLLLEADRTAEAHDCTRRAKDLDPDNPYVWHAVGEVALAMREPQEAIAAAHRARELDSDDDDAILLEARARTLLGQWDAVIARADYVLAGDPDHEMAAVLRALAIESQQVRRGHVGAAEWEELSKRFPLNSFARAGHGWRLLTSGRSSDAQEQFRQALTMDPSSAWAKQGLVLALKAKYPGYGVLLKYFFWLHTLSPRTRTLLAIGGVIGYNTLRRMGEQNPAIKPFILPVLIAYGVFVLVSWLADPLLNLALMANAEARRALDADDKQSGLVVGAALGGGVLLAVVAALTGWSQVYPSAVCVGLASFTIAGAYNCAPGRYRRRLLKASLAFVVAGLLAAVVPDPLAGLLFVFTFLGVIASTWVSRSWAARSYES